MLWYDADIHSFNITDLPRAGCVAGAFSYALPVTLTDLDPGPDDCMAIAKLLSVACSILPESLQAENMASGNIDRWGDFSMSSPPTPGP